MNTSPVRTDGDHDYRKTVEHAAGVERTAGEGRSDNEDLLPPGVLMAEAATDERLGLASTSRESRLDGLDTPVYPKILNNTYWFPLE